MKFILCIIKIDTLHVNEAFLGLASNNVQAGITSFSVANAEKIKLIDIFRYTPEIGAVLRLCVPNIRFSMDAENRRSKFAT